MFINQFEVFQNKSEESIFRFFKFKKIIVNPKNKSWTFHVYLEAVLENIKNLNLFSKKLKKFINEKTNKFIRDLEVNVNFSFYNISIINRDLFQNILMEIINQKKENEIFYILYNSFFSIDIDKKICEFKIDPFIIKYLKDPNILNNLQSLLYKNYNLDLYICNNIQSYNLSSFFDDNNVWEKKINNILMEIINQKKENEIFYILYNSFFSIDIDKKICEFKIDPFIIKYLKDPNILNNLQSLLYKNYNLDLKLILKNNNNAEKNIINNEFEKTYYFSSQEESKAEGIIELSFKEIPFSKDEVKNFFLKYPKFKISGYIQKPEYIMTKNKSILFSFYLLDKVTKQDSIIYRKFFLNDDPNLKKIKKDFKDGLYLEIISFMDKYEKNQEFFFSFDFNKKNNYQPYKILSEIPLHLERMDNYPGKKRIEFHLHTKMSNLDAITSVEEYLNIAEQWQHEAIAFTDHGGIYSFPEIQKFAKNKNIKPILGLEIDFIEEKKIFITNQNQYSFFENFNLKKQNYVVFDLETTGLSKTRDQIIEISAVKIENGKITDKIFDQLINPQIPLNHIITELTGINNDELYDKPTIKEVLPNFLNFIKDHVLVAHNANFDISFLKEQIKKLKIDFQIQPVIDTLTLTQKYFGHKMKFFNLKKMASHFKIKQNMEKNHHRALFDANTTALVFIEILKKLEEQNIISFYDLDKPLENIYERSYHINILVQNQKGYKNLFHLISEALTTDFFKKPRILKSKLEKYKEGLLVGSGCSEGNIFEIALNNNDDELVKAISFYDYIEVQPIHAYKNIIYELGGDQKAFEIIKKTILKIIKEAQKQNKIVIATGDVHYLHPYEKIYREIYINAKLIGGGIHKLYKYSSENLPDNYFLTTQEMLDSFYFIEDDRLKKDIVINNTHLLNEKIEKIIIFPDKLFFLSDNTFEEKFKISSIRQEMSELINNKIKINYGKIIHPIINTRIQKELSSILGNNNKKDDANPSIAPIYYLSYLLSKKSIENNYPVGSRGSIGSSLIANILGITEVNPLKPHYICSNCQYTVIQMTLEEINSEEYQSYIKKMGKDNNSYDFLDKIFSGYDLPDMYCPFCKIKFKKDGQDIPFETFLGFEGKKTPDIDLNFAGDYQSQAHNYLKELMGENNVFRAGTIQTVAKKYAFGYIKGFIKDKNMEDKIRFCEIYRRANIIEGVKRSTGQHPGGIVVVPKENSIFEITPVQYPANDIKSTWKTTHFDYHSFEKNLFKIDILGHDDPTMIKFFMDYVKKNPDKFDFKNYQDIPTDDPKVYEIFANKNMDNLTNQISSLAIPEFGTNFVIEMLKTIYKKEKKNFNFATLVKVSGLSHGTDVWLKNAKDILNKKGDFSEYKEKIFFDDIICCRDEILNTLIKKGIPPLQSFEIMEFVRKGQQHSEPEKWNDLINPLLNKVDEWYLKSLSKIKYLFPKAHATAYVLMAVRIAWFKVHYPIVFYSGFFSKRADQFDYDLMLQSSENIKEKISKLEYGAIRKKITVKEQSLINTLKNTLEMIKRGYNFLPIDLNKSESFLFVIEDDKYLRMPFIAIDGLGDVAAENIVKNRKQKLFSKSDIKERIKINKTLWKKFEELKIIDQLPD
ncbi:DNA polymerase III subunit alpha [Candidatus Phytoplasma sacchari]|uniref:DNA polymerase III PolC-type n=1 Tax=Candidatus Phytoplasma sacchari TaxID=2609813 RepID=A0ABY7M0V0_9MOLU|nr:DNA polymerase III subunit alpha [Candidatus Phytoplasma sacchari]